MAILNDRTDLPTPADADYIHVVDSSDTTDHASGTSKKLTWTNIKAFLKTYFDTLYQTLLSEGAFVDGDKTKLDGIETAATADQTTIVGITGTKAEFNTELSDGSFMFTGDAPTSHTHVAVDVTDFDTEVSNNASVTANTAKVTNATHTGEVTGSGALTLDKTAISNRTDTVITAADTIIYGDATDTDNLKKDTVQGILDLVPAGGTGDMVLADVQTVTGAKTFGGAGAVGKLIIAGNTSGSTILDATAVAGAGTVTLPTTGTLATLAGTETFTNKTLTSPTLTTPILGTPSSGTLTSCTGLPIVAGTTGTLSVLRGGTGVTTSTGTGNTVLSASPTFTGTPVLPSTFTVGANNFVRSGAHSLTLTTSAATNVTLPTTGTIVTQAGTSTLTNKRVQPRTNTTTSTASLTIAGDTTDRYTVTALAAAMTINAPSGTPVDGQRLIIRIKDNATARALTWNAIFRAIGVTLPTTTVISKTMYIGCTYNTADTKWDAIAVAEEA